MISARNVEWGATPLREELACLREAVVREAEQIYESWHPPIERRAFRIAARNLAAYIALRRRDLRALQLSLMPFGLSSLGRCESRVLPTLDAVARSLSYIASEGLHDAPLFPRSSQFFRGERLLQRNAEEMFGKRPGRRSTRIMVTLPSEAATDGAFIQSLVENGMSCARINAAHDSADAWRSMIANIRAAAAATKQYCAVLVDLAGPKMLIESVEFPEAHERVRCGDIIVLAHSVYGPRVPGTPRAICRLPKIFAQLEPGHRVVIDEGRIGARVELADKNGAILRVDQTRETGEKLRAQEGLNFPDTPLNLSPLTADDFHTLDVVANDADLIGYSFVRDAEDVRLLQGALRKRRNGSLPGIILKIETARSVANLPSIIVQSARDAPTAVMIAENQEELRQICEAASVPVVGSTGFTDTAIDERADCMMVNEGPY